MRLMPLHMFYRIVLEEVLAVAAESHLSMGSLAQVVVGILMTAQFRLKPQRRMGI